LGGAEGTRALGFYIAKVHVSAFDLEHFKNLLVKMVAIPSGSPGKRPFRLDKIT
jgi:hypothetical protein